MRNSAAEPLGISVEHLFGNPDEVPSPSSGGCSALDPSRFVAFLGADRPTRRNRKLEGGGTSRPRPFLIALCEQDFSDSNPFQCNQSQLYPVALRTKRRSYESRSPDADQTPTDT